MFLEHSCNWVQHINSEGVNFVCKSLDKYVWFKKRFKKEWESVPPSTDSNSKSLAFLYFYNDGHTIKMMSNGVINFLNRT